MLQAGSIQAVIPRGSASSWTVPLCEPLTGTALTLVFVPPTEMVSWLLEQVVPSESTVITPDTTGEVVPTVNWEPPWTSRATQPVGSSNHNAGVIAELTLLGRTVAERVVPSDPEPNTPPKIRLSVAVTMTVMR